MGRIIYFFPRERKEVSRKRFFLCIVSQGVHYKIGLTFSVLNPVRTAGNCFKAQSSVWFL